MSKNKDFFSQIGSAWIIYKLRWLIIIGIIILVVTFFIVDHDMNEKYQKYGYSSWTEHIKYDEWTGEIVPKKDIENYTSDNKYITNSNGFRITVSKIEELVKQYGEIQGSYASFNENQKESLDSICNTLLREYLDLDYIIIPFGEENLHNYRFKVVGDYENNYYADFSTPSDLRSLSKEVFKDKYEKENNID